jgi:predicted nucleic-acid-binding Zn-ribbon protein
MRKDEIKALFADDVEERRNKIRAYIMDETIPYKDRKEVWLETPDHLMSESAWIIELDDFVAKYGKLCWYSHFYMERYQIVDLRQCTERSYLAHKEKQKDFVKNCMKLGYHSFYNDW